MRVAVLIVHGIGQQGTGYAEDFCNSIDDALFESCCTKEVQYFPFEWQHLIEPQEELNTKKLPKLGWQRTRNFALTYVGDVVAYQRQMDGSFYQDVHAALDAKLVEIANWLGDDGKLVIIAHSLGTVIVSNFIWDMQNKNSVGNKFHMASFTAQDAINKLDTLYTMGSPIYIFSLSHKNGGTPIKVPKWKNIYSRNDVIGYPIKGINDAYAASAVEDIEMKSGGLFSFWNPMSHIKYFDSAKLLDLIAQNIHNM